MFAAVDQGTNDDSVFRFLITTADHRKTFHLQVDTAYEMQEWIRVIRLVSDLGTTAVGKISRRELRAQLQAQASETEAT